MDAKEQVKGHQKLPQAGEEKGGLVFHYAFYMYHKKFSV